MRFTEDHGTFKRVFDVSDDGEVRWTDIEDIAPVLVENERAYRDGDGYSKSRLIKEVAEIPAIVYYDLEAKGLFHRDDPKSLRKFLNNSDFSKFRTSHGKV